MPLSPTARRAGILWDDNRPVVISEDPSEEKILDNYREFIEALREDSFSGFTHMQGRAMAEELLYLLARIYEPEFRAIYREKYPADDFAIVPVLPSDRTLCDMHSPFRYLSCSGPFIKRGAYYICDSPNPKRNDNYGFIL